MRRAMGLTANHALGPKELALEACSLPSNTQTTASWFTAKKTLAMLLYALHAKVPVGRTITTIVINHIVVWSSIYSISYNIVEACSKKVV